MGQKREYWAPVHIFGIGLFVGRMLEERSLGCDSARMNGYSRMGDKN